MPIYHTITQSDIINEAAFCICPVPDCGESFEIPLNAQNAI